MKKLMLLLTLMILQSAMALEVDEKLTLRIIKVSDSRKTLLINRGTEDGLVEGDHAKFFVSSGIVARALCLKVSPSRSVWSVYRLVNADFILNDAVMNLKITPAVKVTQDESKMVVEEDVPSDVSLTSDELSIPLAPGADDLKVEEKFTLQGKSEAQRLLQEAGLVDGTIRERNMEAFLGLSFSSQSGKTTGDSGSYSGPDSYMSLNAGVEIYSKNEVDWWSKFSPLFFIHNQSQGSLGMQGASQKSSLTEYGAGLNWHPWSMPSKINDFIPFLHVDVAMGNSTTNYKPGEENIVVTSVDMDGKSLGYSFGFGVKFYNFKGYGARIMVDYNSRTDKFESIGKKSVERSVAGPRMMTAFSYRW